MQQLCAIPCRYGMSAQDIVPGMVAHPNCCFVELPCYSDSAYCFKSKKIIMVNDKMKGHDEILDIVDQHDQVIGQKSRHEIYQEKLSCFRVVNAFLINSVGQLWIPRRTAHKRIFPLCLDVSMGGHVQSGESYEMALARELSEELNISCQEHDLIEIGYLTPHADRVSAFMKVFEIKTDQTPHYNPDDFCEYYWVTPQEVQFMIKAGEPSKDDLPKLIKRFYL
ncbi:MAG: NUDIX domain-containing protein [Leptolyngbyaceae cyanobacterium]